jgi:hypothetical protein
VGERIDHTRTSSASVTPPPTSCETPSLKKLVYLDGHKAVVYRSRMNPSLGRRAAPPTLITHMGPAHRQGLPGGPARLHSLGPEMQMIAFLTDQVSIRRILDHPGLSTPPQDKPPPIREILRVAEQGESWDVPAEWE